MWTDIAVIAVSGMACTTSFLITRLRLADQARKRATDHVHSLEMARIKAEHELEVMREKKAIPPAPTTRQIFDAIISVINQHKPTHHYGYDGYQDWER